MAPALPGTLPPLPGARLMKPPNGDAHASVTLSHLKMGVGDSLGRSMRVT